MSRYLLVGCVYVCLFVDGVQAEPATVTFVRQAASVGDTAEQSIAVDLKLKSTARRGTEVLEQSESLLQRRQTRTTTTTAVGPHGAQAVKLTYNQAERVADNGPTLPEPVAGKTYLCQRIGEDLQVATAKGDLPPIEEYRIVAQSMQTLGLPNPLVEFFAGRTVRMGEEVQLPKELAAAVLGMDNDLGKAKRFSLQLIEISTIDGARCAVFKTKIDAGSGTASQMGLMVSGQLIMRVVGCRTVSVDLSGPIGMSETRATPTGMVHVGGLGQLRVAIQSTLLPAR